MNNRHTTIAYTREKIITEARVLFKERGYDRTTFKHITERLVMSEETLSTFFASKDDLLEAVWSES